MRPVPKGADAFMIKRVLHDWDGEPGAKIFANCCTAMTEKGKVLLVERVILAGNKPGQGKLADVHMFVIAGGRERTREEFANLFRKAGLKLTRVVPTKCPLNKSRESAHKVRVEPHRNQAVKIKN
jgi:hypothetical protein